VAKRTFLFRLYDIKECIGGIQETIKDADFETYQQTWHMRRAVERGIEIISEASRHLPQEYKDQFPAIPWRQIQSVGNVLRHEYPRIEDVVMWDTAKNHLRQLEPVIDTMIERLKQEQAPNVQRPGSREKT
jgi:uncharacterized protein with HEPN domain